MVYLSLIVFGMGKAAGQITVIGNKQQPCCTFVESSHRKEPFRANIANYIHHSFFCMRIFGGGHKSFWLVHQDVNLFISG